MSTFRSRLRLAVVQACLLTGAAAGQTDESREPANDSATPALETLTLPPQESRGLGAPQRLPEPPGRPDPTATADSSTPGGVGGRELMRVGAALGAVLGLLLLLRSVVRRVGGPLAGAGRPAGVVEVLGRYPIARGQQLVLLKLSGRVVLLHQSKTAMSALSEVTDPDEVATLLARVEAAGRRGAGGFPKLLDRFLARDRAGADDEFARTLGRRAEIGKKVVVDLTRRPRRRKPGGVR